MQRPHTDFVRTAGPVPSFYGILSPATTVVEDNSDSWIAGFSYDIGDARVSVKNRSGFHGPNGGESVVVAPNDNDLLATYLPFFIETSFNASTFALTTEAVQARAIEALDLVTQKAIERELWTGDIAKLLTGDNAGLNRYLASSTATDVTPVAGSGIRPRHAQALLEEALGNATIGSAGTLHAPRSVASVLHTDHSDDGKSLVTHLGNKVVAGSGYLSTGPTGTAPAANLRWMYATGPVTVRVGAVEYTTGTPAQAVNIRQNTTEFKASRPAAVTWSTSDLYAVLVDLSLDYA